LDLRHIDAKSSRDNISGEAEESLSDRIYAWERIPEEGDEGNGHTTVVVFKMDGTLREESGLVCKNLVKDVLSAVLGDHARDERAVGDKIELWGPRMGMRGVETTWSKETGSWKKLAGEFARSKISASILIESPLPMVAGMVSELAEEEKPPEPVVLAG
jgi:hypothetical protein